MSRIVFAAKNLPKNSWTTLRMSTPLFVGSYLQVTWWALGQWKEETFASNDNSIYRHFHYQWDYPDIITITIIIIKVSPLQTLKLTFSYSLMITRLPWRLINPDILMMKTSLLFGWQYVFPSPVYPSLQEHLNEPSVFEHDARLWRQSCNPCTHSSRSKNGKENRLFPEKMAGKFHMMGRKKRSETRQTTEREREREGGRGWRGGGAEGEIKDKRDTYFVKRTTWKFCSGGEKIKRLAATNERYVRRGKKSKLARTARTRNTFRP